MTLPRIILYFGTSADSVTKQICSDIIKTNTKKHVIVDEEVTRDKYEESLVKASPPVSLAFWENYQSDLTGLFAKPQSFEELVLDSTLYDKVSLPNKIMRSVGDIKLVIIGSVCDNDRLCHSLSTLVEKVVLSPTKHPSRYVDIIHTYFPSEAEDVLKQLEYSCRQGVAFRRHR